MCLNKDQWEGLRQRSSFIPSYEESWYHVLARLEQQYVPMVQHHGNCNALLNIDHKTITVSIRFAVIWVWIWPHPMLVSCTEVCEWGREAAFWFLILSFHIFPPHVCQGKHGEVLSMTCTNLSPKYGPETRIIGAVMRLPGCLFKHNFFDNCFSQLHWSTVDPGCCQRAGISSLKVIRVL